MRQEKTYKLSYEYIEDLIKQNAKGIEKLWLVYLVTKRFGVGERMVENRVRLLKELELAKEKDGVLTWNQ